MFWVGDLDQGSGLPNFTEPLSKSYRLSFLKANYNNLYVIMNFSKKYWQSARLLPFPCLLVPSLFLWLHVHFNIVLLLWVCLVSFLLSSIACLYASYHRSSGIHKYWSLQRMDSCLIACSGLGNTCVWMRAQTHTHAAEKPQTNTIYFDSEIKSSVLFERKMCAILLGFILVSDTTAVLAKLYRHVVLQKITRI